MNRIITGICLGILLAIAGGCATPPTTPKGKAMAALERAAQDDESVIVRVKAQQALNKLRSK